MRFLIGLALGCLCYGQMTTEQKVADITSLSQFYVRHYTPANWKIVQFGFDLRDLQPWLAKVRATKNDLEYYDIVIDYLASLDDAHIRYTMPSGFSAYLRFDVDLYDGKPLVEFISSAFPRRDFPIELGDELVSLDGVGWEEWIRRLSRYGIGANTSATRRRAVDFITFRPQSAIPWAAQIGETARVVLRKADGSEVTYNIPWSKTGTAIVNLPPVVGPRLATQSPAPLRDPLEKYSALAEAWGISNEQDKQSSIAANDDQRGEAHPADIALTGLGQRTPLYAPPPGFRLRLGSNATDVFLSGTFEVDGKTVGLIRIPSFSPANTAFAVQQFRAEIIAMQASTSALVVDVMHNPGGNLCYGQNLLQYLIPQPFWGVGYWIKPTQQWKLNFENRLTASQNPAVPQWERDLLGTYYQLVSSAFDKGEETGVFPICSSSITVLPQDVVYTKPIIVLTNEFSVSTGDAFPALFQDAGRGKIVGIRTGGLGGNVNDYSNTGITEANLRITRSLFVREKPVPSPYGLTRFVENVGVTPDVQLEIMTRENLLNGGRPFVQGWIDEVKKIMQ